MKGANPREEGYATRIWVKSRAGDSPLGSDRFIGITTFVATSTSKISRCLHSKLWPLDFGIHPSHLTPAGWLGHARARLT